MASNSSLCLSGKSPSPLSESNICNLGFYCPNNTATHPPEYCPPEAGCLITRLQPKTNVCDEPQGVYEPIVCRIGHYCPKGGKQQLVCPQGYYCPRGSFEPLACKTLSRCPEGSGFEMPLFGFLVCGLLDFALIMLVVFGRFIDQRNREKNKLAIESQEGRLEIQPEGENYTRGDWLELMFPQDSSDVGMELEFRDISVRKPKSSDFILTGINGKAEAKSLTGIMGQSGSGKTTLAKILVGKVRANSGTLLLNRNEKDLVKGYHVPSMIGFVPQDDIVHPHLTVYENILHSARVRLGGALTDKSIKERVDIVIEGLGLSKVKYSVVGSEEKRIISGGECKRVSIGLELVAAPRVLILDEPTSGLDAQAALSLMSLLGVFSRHGLTVIAVVHQPRVEIFKALDNLILLESGKCAYAGKASKAEEFFSSQGVQFDPNLNPADLIIDFVSAKGRNEGLKVNWNSEANSLEKTMGPLNESYLSNSSSSTFENLEAVYNKTLAPWYRQLILCIWRDLIQQTRQVPMFVVEIAGAALTGTLVGLIVHEFHGQTFQGIYVSPFEILSSAVSYSNVTILAILGCLAISFSAAYPSVATFGEESLIFLRESHSGHSGSAYFVSKSISCLPRIFFGAWHFTSFFAILATPFASFNTLFVLNFLYFYSIYGLGSVATAISPRENSPLICLLLAIVIAVLGGSQPRLATVKTWNLLWMWDISAGRWYAEAFANEHFSPFSYLYDMGSMGRETGFTFGRSGFDCGILLLVGSICRILGCLLMTLRGWSGW